MSAGRLDSLQLLRALAVTIVICFHLEGAMALPKYFGRTPWPPLFPFGHAGVDLFFVISGFLIYRIHRADVGQPGRLRRFILKRAIRIYPSYLIVFVLVAAALLVVKGTLAPDITSWLVLVKSLLLIPQDIRVVGGTGAPVLIVAWSLQYEMCFYAAFAAFIASIRGASAILLVVLLLALLDRDAFLGRFVLDARSLQFVIGIVAARQLDRLGVGYGRALAALGAMAFIAGGILENEGLLIRERLPFTHALVFGLASAAIIAGLVALEQRGTLRVPRWIVRAGDASYATYLIHFTLISGLGSVGAAMLGRSTPALVAFFFVGVAACLAAGGLFCQWIERPVLRYLEQRAGVSRQPNEAAVDRYRITV